MIYRIHHITEYQYKSPVSLCYNLAHLLPRDTDYQKCHFSEVIVSPRPDYTNEYQDYFGNRAFYFSVQNDHQKLVIDVRSEINTEAQRTSLDLELGNTCARALERLKNSSEPDIIDAHEFLMDSPMVERNAELKAFAAPLFDDETPLLSAVRALTKKIFDEFEYDPQSTNIATPLREVLQQRKGVCQDFAHLAIACLRSLGFPARYISGYLETLPPVGEEKLIGADASHAWFAVYSPGEGWFEFDPTNDNMPAEQHITTAWGRDYSDVTPLQGVIFDGGNEQSLKVSVDVKRIA